MYKSNDTLARKMATFCKQRSQGRASRPTPLAQTVLGVVVAALLARYRSPCWNH